MATKKKPTKKPPPAKAAKPTKTKAKQSKAAKPAAPKAKPASKDEDRWWSLIDRSRKDAEDPEEQADQLVELLAAELSESELVAFDKFVNERIRDAFRWDLWAVAYIMNGGCSDDGFDYFCGWLVGKGKKHYDAALANPEDAAKGVSPDDEPFENEGMWYAAAHAWGNKTGKSSDDFYQVAVPVTRSLIGEPFDEETVYDDHPKLAKKFAG
jgi:hypothetical protein